jgi:uncharacterized membrane protein YtjA (UPF0391 family)
LPAFWVANCATPTGAAWPARGKPNHLEKNGAHTLLNIVVTLLIIALIAAVLGFGGMAVTAAELAKVVFFVIILLSLISVSFGALGGRWSLL